MNQERLKAALDSGFDEASGEAAKDDDGNWATISEEMGQIQEVADDLGQPSSARSASMHPGFPYGCKDATLNSR